MRAACRGAAAAARGPTEARGAALATLAAAEGLHSISANGSLSAHLLPALRVLALHESTRQFNRHAKVALTALRELSPLNECRAKALLCSALQGLPLSGDPRPRLCQARRYRQSQQ